jgi:hypothetical protein
MTETTSTLNVNGIPAPAARRPLWWQAQGLSFTASGYGRRIPTSWVVQVENRWRRVYCCIFSNSGTCYIEGPKGENGKREWRVVTD